MFENNPLVADIASTLLLTSSDAIALVGQNRRIRSCNPSFLNLLNLTHKDARDLDCQPLFPDLRTDDPDFSIDDDYAPVRFVRPDGVEKWVLMKFIPAVQRDQPYRLIMVQDPATVRRIIDRLDYVESYDVVSGLYSRRRGMQELRALMRSEPHGFFIVTALRSKDMHILERSRTEYWIQAVLEIFKTLPCQSPLIVHTDTNEILLASTDPSTLDPASLADLKTALANIVPEQGNTVVSSGYATWSGHTATALEVLDGARLDQLSQGTKLGKIPRQMGLTANFANQLRAALVTGQFEFYIQPQIDADTRQAVGGELLIRWNHPHEGLIPPNKFIDHLEEGIFAEEFAKWSIIEASKVLVCLHEAIGRWFPLSLNIAAPQFTSSFARLLMDAMNFRGIPATSLEVEITERLLADEPERTLETLNAMRDMGFAIAIDDFGTGYSSLSYIRRFPLDRLKIDRSFVVNLSESEEDRLIATAIASLAHVLGLEVIAEGVETPAQARFLKSIGCEYFQGYLVGKPMPLDQFVAFLKSAEGPENWWDDVNTVEMLHPVEERKVKTVVWKRSFSTDISSIDDDHRELIDLLNTLTEHMQNPDAQIDVEDTLERIGQETIRHFEHEERVMENINYDRIDAHRHKHQALISDFAARHAALLEAYKAGDLEELVNYLKFWVLRHLISEDTRLHRYLNRASSERRL